MVSVLITVHISPALSSQGRGGGLPKEMTSKEEQWVHPAKGARKPQAEGTAGAQGQGEHCWACPPLPCEQGPAWGWACSLRALERRHR